MKLSVILSVSAALGVAAHAWAGTGTVELWISPYSGGVGSEFTAVTTPPLYGSYAPSTTLMVNGQQGFQTFCLQAQALVDIGSFSYMPVTYNFSLGLDVGATGNVVLGGGLQGTELRIFPNMPATPLGDLKTMATPMNTMPLTEGAAWLYSQFAQGALQNYDFANTGTSTAAGLAGTRVADAEALQAAIWFLQGGQTDSAYVSGGMGNVYYDEALDHFGSADAMAAGATYSTDFGVEVMSLTDAKGAAAQNQLVYLGIPLAPDNVSTFSILCASVAGLVIVARREKWTLPPHA